MGVDSEEWERGRRLEADRLWDEALRVTKLSATEAEALSRRGNLTGELRYEHELAAWQTEPEVFDVDSVPAATAESTAAVLFLRAGQGFTDAHDFDRAFLSLHLAVNYARRVRSAEARRVESRAAHDIAYAYLTLVELAADEEQRRKANEMAARYQDFEAFLLLRQGDHEKSADAYTSAAFRYQKALQFELAARSAAMAGQRFQAASNPVRAADALMTRADLLFAVDDKDLRTDAILSLVEAGRLLSMEDSEKARAAEVLLDAGYKALDLGRSTAVGARGDFLPKIAESLRSAQRLYEVVGEFAKADECHYVASRVRREVSRRSRGLAAKLAVVVSSLFDVVWGYGTRPGRLLVTGLFVLLMFGSLYFMVGDPVWPNHDTRAYSASRALVALIVSASALVPVQLIERTAKLHALPPITLSPVGEVLVLIESLIGLALVSMGMFSATRSFRRRYLPAGSD